jgi:tetratricopeptide (TPR) repeat protein
MSYAHAKDVVHRDLKPSNIMVGRFGEVYVMDWGLARIVGSKDEKDIRIRAEPETSVLHSERHENLSSDAETPLCTMDGDVVGTPAYMSPEQAEGRLDELGPRSDVYSVGAILYHLISGQVPYVKERMKANNYAIWRWVQAGPPDPLEVVAPNAPPEIISICERAMDRDASQRYPTIGDLAAELRAYLEGRVVLSHRTGLAIELRKWTQRNQLAAAALAAAALFLLVGAATVYWVQSSKLSAIEAEQAQTLAAKQRAEALSRTVAEAAAAALALRKENLVMQADYAIETANLAQVEVLMAEYRGLDPEDFLPHLVLARGYSQYLRGAEAEREFRRARDLGYEDAPLDADDARGLYLRGLALVIERDPARLDEAIRCLSEAVRLDARMRAAYFPLYSLHKERGDLVSAEQALAAFHEILATGDDYYGVVAAFRAELQGRFQDAIDVLLRTQLRVGEARARELRLDRILGRLYLSQEAQHAESERSASALDAADLRLHAAVLSVPSDAASWANLGQVELRRYLRDPAGATAVEHLQRMLRYGRRAVLEHPRFAQGYRIVLNALVFTATRSFDPYDSDSKLLDEAREVAAELRNLDPQHPSLALMEAEIDFHAGMRAEALGQDEPAEELYLRSLARNPNQVLPRLWLAQRAYAREEFEAAVEQLREARSVLSRHAQEAAIRALPEVFITKLHIWTLGAAGRVEGPAAIELGLSAHEDIQAAIDDGREIETLELLNYVEFLATSPRAELRDCEEARRVFESHGLAEKLRGTPYAESVRAVEAALRDC